jgi:N-acetylglutamate synthase-like GNAT family acetyltransferase
MEISSPKSKEELEAYYDLRFRILREPWGQPKGSEKDELEGDSIHLAAVENGKVIGCGRLHFNSPEEAQIRYMAVEEDLRGKGVGEKILKELEKRAGTKGAKRIILNSRDTAVGFYKKNSYTTTGKSHTLFGEIPHFKMEKALA